MAGEAAIPADIPGTYGCSPGGSPGSRGKTITFGTYIRQLVKFGLSSSAAFALVGFVLLLVVGDVAADIDLTLAFGTVDGVLLLIVLPVITILLLLLLSPLSFRIHRILARPRRKADRDEPS